MKRIFIFLVFFLLHTFLFSQAGNSRKKQVAKVSKYSLKLDKNTKKVLNKTPVLLDASSNKFSFNYQYSLYLNSPANNKNFQALVSAYALDSTNSELYFEMAKYYEISGNKSNKRLFCKKLQTTKLTSALKEYAYNTLMSVEKNGILITYGERDTYPIWILQTLENVRTDVTVLKL